MVPKSRAIIEFEGSPCHLELKNASSRRGKNGLIGIPGKSPFLKLFLNAFSQGLTSLRNDQFGFSEQVGAARLIRAASNHVRR